MSDDRKKTPVPGVTGMTIGEITEEAIKDGQKAILAKIKDKSLREEIKEWLNLQAKPRKKVIYFNIEDDDLNTVQGNKETIQKIIRGSAAAINDGSKNSLRIAEGGTKIVKMCAENIKLLGEDYEEKIAKIKKTLSKYADAGRTALAENKVLKAENERLKAKLEMADKT